MIASVLSCPRSAPTLRARPLPFADKCLLLDRLPFYGKLRPCLRLGSAVYQSPSRTEFSLSLVGATWICWSQACNFFRPHDSNEKLTNCSKIQAVLDKDVERYCSITLSSGKCLCWYHRPLFFKWGATTSTCKEPRRRFVRFPIQCHEVRLVSMGHYLFPFR